MEERSDDADSATVSAQHTTADVWVFGLDASSIEDGNYPDLRQGDGLEFAVEFMFRTEPVRTTETENRAEHLGGPFYELTAQVVAVLDHVWIIDCGILAHQVRRQIASDLVVGDVIRGRAYLGLEGYGEFTEGPNAAPHMPALVYSWTIDSLLMNTTPWLTMDGGGLRRDETRRRYQPIQRTDASSDDDGRADYLLTCTKQTVDPKVNRGRPGRV